MKVYIVVKKDYDDFNITDVFASKVRAEERAGELLRERRHNETKYYEVEEWWVNDRDD